jgi:hypothetical protein
MQAERADHPKTNAQGKRRSLVQPQPLTAGHPFFQMLHQWGSKGVPVNCGLDWKWDAVLAAVARGPHIKDMDPENIPLVHEDVQYQVDADFSNFLWDDLKKQKPQKIKISPIPVVPQKDQRGRLILDFSFQYIQNRPRTTPDLLQSRWALRILQ